MRTDSSCGERGVPRSGMGKERNSMPCSAQSVPCSRSSSSCTSEGSSNDTTTSTFEAPRFHLGPEIFAAARTRHEAKAMRLDAGDPVNGCREHELGTCWWNQDALPQTPRTRRGDIFGELATAELPQFLTQA